MVFNYFYEKNKTHCFLTSFIFKHPYGKNDNRCLFALLLCNYATFCCREEGNPFLLPGIDIFYYDDQCVIPFKATFLIIEDNGVLSGNTNCGAISNNG